MTIRALIFDYGNVLDIPEDPQRWVEKSEKIAAQMGLTGDELWKLFYNGDPWQQVKVGQISRETYWNTVLHPLGFTEPGAQRAFVTAFFEGRDNVHPDMAALLRLLKPHYRLGMLSNTDIVDLDRWLAEERGLPGIFDVVISSAQVGMAKPDPQIYWYTLKELGVAADEALFIDDMVRNTSAAQAVGIPSITFKSPIQLHQELQALGIL